MTAGTVSASQLRECARVLGLDLEAVVSIHVSRGGAYVTRTDGHSWLAARGK